jgi:tRNA(Leu) C34 or U34 (ribose-2'-O)-methylase TrmL
LSVSFYADGVGNEANLRRIEDAAHLLGVTCSTSIAGRLIAVENTPGAREIYGRRPLRDDATIVVGNERRGISRRLLATAAETVVIPTQSRTVNTLNVAAAAAVAGWFLLRGSGRQATATRPEQRRPAVLLVGDDHVEVGSALRSAAAFGFRDVLLEDRGAGWFTGSSNVRREARATARRHKNPLRVHPTTLAESAVRYDEIVLVTASGAGVPLSRERLTHGLRQLIVVGAANVTVASLGLQPLEPEPLRLAASIALAEIARQVGRRRPVAGAPARAPRYEKALEPAPGRDVLLVDPADLLVF